MSQAKTVWRFQLDRQFSRADARLQGIEFTSRWVVISDGVLTVRAGYAWDGCSPAYYLPLVGWVSPPNGRAGQDGFPQAYYPSLVHDCFCQFRPYIAIDKATVVAIFQDMLMEAGFAKWAARLYAGVVNRLGPQHWVGQHGYTFDIPPEYVDAGAWAKA